MRAGCLIFRGQAQHGELGYGPKGKKSSANPDKCMALEGVYCHQVSSEKYSQAVLYQSHAADSFPAPACSLS